MKFHQETTPSVEELDSIAMEYLAEEGLLTRVLDFLESRWDGRRRRRAALGAGPSPMLRRRLAALLLLLVLLVGLWIGASGLVVWKLTRRPVPQFAKPAPNVSWGRVADVRLQTRDGHDIGGWLVEGRPERPSVVLLHGNG